MYACVQKGLTKIDYNAWIIQVIELNSQVFLREEMNTTTSLKQIDFFYKFRSIYFQFAIVPQYTIIAVKDYGLMNFVDLIMLGTCEVFYRCYNMI